MALVVTQEEVNKHSNKYYNTNYFILLFENTIGVSLDFQCQNPHTVLVKEFSWPVVRNDKNELSFLFMLATVPQETWTIFCHSSYYNESIDHAIILFKKKVILFYFLNS
jgi:hypothetical protein